MVIVLMGVTGCGKTTVGELLAEKLGWSFFDADGFHPSQNVEKMRAGIPLTDQDRLPWLEALAELIRNHQKDDCNAVLACSALKEGYRRTLAGNCQKIKFVHLKGDRELIRQRLAERKGHYMNPNLLQSQFDTLEEPTDSDSLAVNVSPTPEQIVDDVCQQLMLLSS